MKNPENLKPKDPDSSPPSALPETLEAQRQRLLRGMERLIDSLAEGVIDKDQFISRMSRTKSRIADIETKLAAHVVDEERRTHVRSVMIRLEGFSIHLQAQLNDADWTTKREIIRTLIQRIEFGPASVAVILRLPAETRASEPIIVTLSRA